MKQIHRQVYLQAVGRLWQSQTFGAASFHLVSRSKRSACACRSRNTLSAINTDDNRAMLFVNQNTNVCSSIGIRPVRVEFP